MSAIGAALAIGGAITTGATAVGGAVAAGLGAVGASAGVAGAVGTAVTAGIQGAVYGSLISGGMAAITGGDIGDAMLSGAMMGGVTMGMGSLGGSLGSSIASFANLGKYGTAIASGVGGGLAAGGTVYGITGEATTAITSGLTAGVLSGMQGFQNFEAQAQFDSFTADLRVNYPELNVDQMISEGLISPNKLSLMEIATSGTGRLVTALASGAKALTGVEIPTEMAQKHNIPVESGTPTAINEPKSAQSTVLLDGNDVGSGWGRESGDLFAGVEQVASTIPEGLKKTARGISDELLGKNGAMIGLPA